MQKTRRVLIQVISWLLIWIVLWLIQGGDYFFFNDNVAAFLCQTLVIITLVWYMAPKLLFKKRYILFAGLSILLIFLGAYFASNFVSNPPPPPINLGPPKRPVPTQFFVHLLLIGIAYILATLLETFVFAQKKEEETIRNKNEKLQTELKLLKSQINPHFLFNSLNNIYALSVINSDRTQRSISYLSDMLRYVLYECDQQLVPLEREITYIENYIKLFSLKSSKTYPITTDFEVLDHTIKVAPMLFIPFMENALKHSNIEKITDAFIRIKIHADAREVQFEIENSNPKQPISKDKLGGIGIENVKRRLAILYPGRHHLHLDTNGAIFKVGLKLIMNENDEVFSG